MITEDQSAVIDFLSRPSTHGGAPVERIETHSAIVFLAAARAYKLKRAVRFDYLDFSTAALRRTFCDAEVRLNSRTAPHLYRRVLPVTREPNRSLALDGAGNAIDWLVEMNRFPQKALFDKLASTGHLNLSLMSPLADAIGAFHTAAERRTDHGGVKGMRWVIDGNALGLVEFGAGWLDQCACARMIAGARCELNKRAALLDSRRQSGYVRQCHGDLHLRNIVLLDGQPTLFDGVEFNDEIACTDVHYDLAFLLMDLWRRRLPQHANALWNRYLAQTGDLDGAALQPLFLSCRAAVRAKTSATAARAQSDANRRIELKDLAREYLLMAEQFLHPAGPRLIAVGGFSGSGKSTLAQALAPTVGAVPGAVVLRSDEIRKQLFGMARLQHLAAEAYNAVVSERVYHTLADQAGAILRAGHSVIVDAVYARRTDRQAIEHVAAEASAPFVGLWLDAPESTLIARVNDRRGDPSDATTKVVRLQLAQAAAVSDWQRVDASDSPATTLRFASEYLLRVRTNVCQGA